jgi:glutaredoxin 3
MMSDLVTVYTGKNCPFCVRAKQLLMNKGIPFKEIDISNNEELSKEMIRITGKMTVPQILIQGKPVGGCDDLYELERRGELDRLLKNN